jgi:hypothetical protein
MFRAIITKKNEVSNFQQRKLNDNRSGAPQLHVTPIYMDILDIQVYTNTHKGKGNTINRIQRGQEARIYLNFLKFNWQ